MHRHEALLAFVHDDPARARAAFRSALVNQPSYRLPEDIAPAGNPLAALYDEARALGPGPAILLQAVPFAFMHLGKPEVETLSTIFGGAAFGLIAWRTRSFLYPWLIHWFIVTFTLLVAVGWL